MTIGNISRKYAHPQLAMLLQKITKADASASILINSDSTGNETTEWIYMFSEWLAIMFPAYTVRYRLWDVAASVYFSPVSINTGSGAFFIDIWNGAYSGARPSWLLGTKYTKAVSQVVDTSIYTDVSKTVDLFILNHSHNMIDNGIILTKLMVAQTINDILNTHTSCGVICFYQNPLLTGEDAMIIQRRSVVEYALSKGYGIANVYDKFIALNKDSSLYFDNIHPSKGYGNTGQQLFLNAITELFANRKYITSFKNEQIPKLGRNIIKNGNFLVWTTPASTPPDGFTVSGGVCSKDSVVFDDPSKGYSCLVTATGGAMCFFRWDASASELEFIKGKYITLAIRYKISSAVNPNDTDVGICNTQTSSQTTYELVRTPAGEKIFDRWVWGYSGIYVRPSDTSAIARIFLTQGSALANQKINIDRFCLTIGSEPCDCI